MKSFRFGAKLSWFFERIQVERTLTRLCRSHWCRSPTLAGGRNHAVAAQGVISRMGEDYIHIVTPDTLELYSTYHILPCK